MPTELVIGPPGTGKYLPFEGSAARVEIRCGSVPGIADANRLLWEHGIDPDDGDWFWIDCLWYRVVNKTGCYEASWRKREVPGAD